MDLAEESNFPYVPSREARFSQLIGHSLKGLNPDETLKLISAARQGLPKSAAVSFMKQTGFTQKELADILNFSLRTLQLYDIHDKLSKDASERLMSLSLLYAKAEEVFGSHETVYTWMHNPCLSLGNIRPLDLLDTHMGFELVNDELGRIGWGIYS